MKVLVINGPNINMLGIREPGIYGRKTFADLEEFIRESARECGAEVELFQSNHEGAIVDKIQEAYGAKDGIVYNPGAHTHYSYAIRDAIGGIDVPCVEVHISDVDAREQFRRVSYAGMACEKKFSGMGFEGYREAIKYLAEKYGACRS